MSRRGFTIVEGLVAALILSLSLMMLGGIWSFSYYATAASIERTSAHSLARQTLERIRETGFDYAPEGSTTTYYDKDLGGASSTLSSQHQFSVGTSIISDRTVVDPSTGATVPADSAIRTVTVRVSSVKTGKLLFQAGTYLVRSGI